MRISDWSSDVCSSDLIKAAHHFKYKWPIQYKVTDFSVITEAAGADGNGQTDVGGMYAWVMLQAYELTREERYLHEARAAIDARSEERRVGKECGSTCRSRWSPTH